MDTTGLMKNYFLKVALPIVTVTLIAESIITPNSFLNSKIGYMVMAGNGQMFLQERGGLRDSSARGREFHERVNFNIYEADQAKTLPLKEFMVEHVTKFEPAIMLGLADTWPALNRWNLTAEDNSGA